MGYIKIYQCDVDDVRGYLSRELDAIISAEIDRLDGE